MKFDLSSGIVVYGGWGGGAVQEWVFIQVNIIILKYQLTAKQNGQSE
jgi:hypothetical protein